MRISQYDTVILRRSLRGVSAVVIRMGSGREIISAFVNPFLLVYVALFPIVNPIGGEPIFLGLTRHCNEKERDALALRVARNSLFLLLSSLLVGSYVLDFFGITLPMVRVAGGLVVAAIAWNLLQTGNEGNQERSAITSR